MNIKYNPDIHKRGSLRLPGYDYSRAGAYFVTICVQNRECLFGKITDGIMRLNDAGHMVKTVWDEIPIHYPGIDTHEFVVMPNHVHGIIFIVGAGPCACPDTATGRPQRAAPTGGTGRTGGTGGLDGPVGMKLSLPDVVHRFKTMTTKQYADGVKQSGWPRFDGRLWQRNYWEHVIRNEPELYRIREYIIENPGQWASDKLHP